MICWIYDWPSAGLLALALTDKFPREDHVGMVGERAGDGIGKV